MKENTITKYECEICHTMYDKKESAVECEEHHNRLEKIIPIKKIYYDEDYFPQIGIEFYPNAVYNKENDCIKLHNNGNLYGSEWHRQFWYRFDEIQEDDEKNEIKIYTTNLNPKYEEECIKKIIDFKINKLNEEIGKLKEANTWENISHNEYR